MEDIIKKLREKKKKVQVSLTLDGDVYDDLVDFKKLNNIPTMSPMISEMLRDWLKKQEMEALLKKAEQQENNKSNINVIKEEKTNNGMADSNDKNREVITE